MSLQAARRNNPTVRLSKIDCAVPSEPHNDSEIPLRRTIRPEGQIRYRANRKVRNNQIRFITGD